MMTVSQGNEYDVRTENDTWTSAERYEIGQNQMCDFDVSFKAFREDNGAVAHFRLAGRAVRGTGNLVLTGSLLNLITAYKDASALLWDTRVEVVNNTELQFSVKGAAANNVRWSSQGIVHAFMTG